VVFQKVEILFADLGEPEFYGIVDFHILLFNFFFAYNFSQNSHLKRASNPLLQKGLIEPPRNFSKFPLIIFLKHR
jgi:hypothetical protein